MAGPSMLVEAPFSLDFLSPFYDGQPSDPAITRAYHVSIDGHPYMLDVKKLGFATVPTQREASDSSDEPGESTLNPAGAWPRGASRFDKGAGQQFFDLKMEDLQSSRRRWYASKGIDGLTLADALTLLPDTTKTFTSTATNLFVVAADNWNYLSHGSTLLGNLVGTGTTVSDTANGVITSLATDGRYIYVTSGTGILERAEIGDVTAPLANFGTTTPDRVFFANGRLITADGASIYEIDNAGAVIGTDIYTYPHGAGGEWVACTGTPIGIFLSFTLGDRSSIYHVTTNDAGDALTAPRFAGNVPGETIESLTSFSRFIIIGTSLGVRVATYNEGGDLDIGPLIETGSPVTVVRPAGSFVYFAWTNYDATSTGLGRLDLRRNTEEETFKPAYQSDLMATAQGAVQGIAETIDSVTGARLIAFTVSGVGSYVQAAELVTSGTYDSGWVRWGTLTPKVISGVEVGHDPLAGEIEVRVQGQDDVVRDVGTSNTPDSTESGLLLASIKTRAAKVLLTLRRSAVDDETGPAVRFWRVNALPAPSTSVEWHLPIIWKRQVETLNKRKVPQDLVLEYGHLKRLERSGQIATIQLGDLTFDAQVRRVAMESGDGESWSVSNETGGGMPRRMPEGTVYVVAVEREQA